MCNRCRPRLGMVSGVTGQVPQPRAAAALGRSPPAVWSVTVRGLILPSSRRDLTQLTDSRGVGAGRDRESCAHQASGPLLRAVQDTDDCDYVVTDLVDNQEQ